MIDQRSAQTIATLLPAVQGHFRAFYEAANAYLKLLGYEARFISGTRSYAEQEALYAQGRTKAGPRVTNARPGYSNHNFGVAVDVGLFKAGKYMPESLKYAEIAPIGEKCGLKWGGRWKSPDRPHYEFPTGLTLAQMRARVASGVALV